MPPTKTFERSAILWQIGQCKPESGTDLDLWQVIFMRTHKCLSGPASLLLILSILRKLKLYLQCSGTYGLYKNVHFCLFLQKAISPASMKERSRWDQHFFFPLIVFSPKSSSYNYRMFCWFSFPSFPHDSKQNLVSYFSFMVIPILYSLSGQSFQ